MIDSPKVITLEPRHIAVIHLSIPSSEIRHVMGPGLAELHSAVAQQGIEFTGPWFTHHFRIEPGKFDFEIGLSVARAVTAAGRMTPGEWPAMSVAQTVYRGPFEGLPAAWGEFDAWVKSQGLQPAVDLWERYLVGPESGPDPAQWQTEFNRPLVG